MSQKAEAPVGQKKKTACLGIARRSFLGQLAGVPVAAAGLAHAAGTPQAQQGMPPGPQPKAPSGGTKSGAIGRTQRVDGEVKEYRDPETGARVMQLTGDGSDNVHLYFTSQSFLGGGSERVVFGSNRSGRYQYYLLEIRERRLVQGQMTLGAGDRQRLAQAARSRA